MTGVLETLNKFLRLERKGEISDLLDNNTILTKDNIESWVSEMDGRRIRISGNRLTGPRNIRWHASARLADVRIATPSVFLAEFSDQ